MAVAWLRSLLRRNLRHASRPEELWRILLSDLLFIRPRLADASVSFHDQRRGTQVSVVQCLVYSWG